MDLISVIVPIYNSEKTMKRCIDSLIHQTYKRLEIILVNDGSTDKSKEICKLYCSKYNNIKVINQENSGVSNSRNIGINSSKGKYILFCDSDDFVEPDWCYILYESIKSEESGLSICGYNSYDEKMNIEKINIYDENLYCSYMYTKEFIKLRKKSLLNSVWNKMFIADVIKLNNIKFKDIPLGEDTIFVLNYISKIKKISIINKPLYNYLNCNSESLSKRYNKNLYYYYKSIFDSIKRLAEVNDLKTDEYYQEYYSSYFKAMLAVLDNTLNELNKDSFYKKIRYNTKIINDNDFKRSIKYADLEDYNKYYLLALKSRSYIVFYLFKKLYKLKNYKVRR